MNPLLAVTLLGALVLGAGQSAQALELAGVGGAHFTLKITSLREARFKATTRQQFDFSCGSAALATLLTYHYNHPVTEQAVFDEMFAQGDQAKIRKEGFSLLDMKNYLKVHGFQADGFALPLDKLLESKLPAVVLIAEKGYHHFVVIKGMRDGRILMGDPSTGTRAVSRAHFDAVWVNQLLFVVHNQQAQAQFNQASDWQVAPRAPLTAGLPQDGLSAMAFSKLGPGDF